MVETNDEEEFLTRREADILVSAADTRRVEQSVAHGDKHLSENEAIVKALEAENAKNVLHNLAHAQAHISHEEKHTSETGAVKTYFESSERERGIHAEAHDREHVDHSLTHTQEQSAVRTALDAASRERDIHATAHQALHHAHDKEHELNKLAISKAESAADMRFTSVNAFRAQLNDVITNLASKETVDALAKDNNRRFEEARTDRERRFAELSLAITNIEKGDVKQEGKGMGQSAIVAIIVTAVGLVGAVLSILIVAANALSAG